MTIALVVLAPGFEEIEAVSIIDVLRRAEVEVTVAGTEPGVLTASRGVRIEPEALLSDLPETAWDLVVLPGGMGGALALKAHEGVGELLRNQADAGRWIGAICAAPLVLAHLDLLRDRAATCHPSVRDQVPAQRLSDERVVVDGNIVTSQGPGTAIEFALTLVRLLRGPDVAAAVNVPLLARWP